MNTVHVIFIQHRVLVGINKFLFGHAAQEHRIIKYKSPTPATLEPIRVLIHQTLQKQREITNESCNKDTVTIFVQNLKFPLPPFSEDK